MCLYYEHECDSNERALSHHTRWRVFLLADPGEKGDPFMKGAFVSEIQKNTQVEGVFLVKEKSVGVTKNGSPYLSLKLMDRSGDITARIWDRAEQYDRLFNRNDFIRISSRSSIYQGGMQLTITTIEKCCEAEIDLENFLPVCSCPRDSMLSELFLIAQGVRDTYIRQLLRLFFEDEEFVKAFKRAPAAKTLHHVYLGGLLEHSLSVTRLAEKVANSYSDLNRDVLIAGAMLHDVGKVAELSYGRVFDYTDSGRLLGHITLGVEMLEEKIRKVDGFPEDLRMILKHMLLSHHGEYEYGSPKRPKTLEALVLYYLDDLDAKINGFQQFVAKEGENDSRWSRFHKLFARYLFRQSYISKDGKEDIKTLDAGPFEEIV